jgi:hypothetical protein
MQTTKIGTCVMEKQRDSTGQRERKGHLAKSISPGGWFPSHPAGRRVLERNPSKAENCELHLSKTPKERKEGEREGGSPPFLNGCYLLMCVGCF